MCVCYSQTYFFPEIQESTSCKIDLRHFPFGAFARIDVGDKIFVKCVNAKLAPNSWRYRGLHASKRRLPEKLRSSWQWSNDRESIDSSQFVTSVRHRLHTTPLVLPLFFINVPAEGHQSRPLFRAFFAPDKWIPPSSCFPAPDLRFPSNRERAVVFENVRVPSHGLFPPRAEETGVLLAS